jgi:hypothetical protein
MCLKPRFFQPGRSTLSRCARPATPQKRSRLTFEFVAAGPSMAEAGLNVDSIFNFGSDAVDTSINRNSIYWNPNANDISFANDISGFGLVEHDQEGVAIERPR